MERVARDGVARGGVASPIPALELVRSEQSRGIGVVRPSWDDVRLRLLREAEVILKGELCTPGRLLN
jgi:hypothetical protein